MIRWAVNRRRRVFVALMLGAPSLAWAQRDVSPDHLQPLHDLRPIVASMTQHRAPLLILFSTLGCPFCREVRRNYLVPRVTEQAQYAAPQLLLREVDITSQRPIIDRAGAQTTEAVFALRFNVRVVPVVALLDSKLQIIGEPLVGLDRSGFYEGYLAAAIDAARKRVQQTS